MANKNESKSLLGKIWRIKWWLLSIFTVLFLLFALFFPLNNYYVELPGGAFDTKEVLTVDKKADDSKGSYNFVAVAQTKATLALMLYAQLNDFAKLKQLKRQLEITLMKISCVSTNFTWRLPKTKRFIRA